jgi:hypothetical protein
MSIEELVIEKLRTLSPERQKEVLNFVESLKQTSTLPAPRRSLKGLWADLGVDISDQDIAEAGREMWGNFPKETF